MNRTLAAVVALLLSCATVTGWTQGQRPPVKWNRPDGPAISGVVHGSYKSKSMATEVGYNVSLPAGYQENTARYPVIYFLHGAGGDENSDAGGFSELVRKMVEEKKIPPSICVFPNGGMGAYQDRPATIVMGETMLIGELLPLIDQAYRTKPEPKYRAITGFSMGGGGAIRLSLKHPELFSTAASWAGAVLFRNLVDPPELKPIYLQDTRGRVRLLLIVGDQDITFNGTKLLTERLDRAKYPYRYKVLQGVTHNLGQYYEQTGDELLRFLTASF